ncbi:MAG TPA: hypothetical protein VGM64_06195 [Lacunisphaera sp.]|jgi:hypothetical protein
MRYFPLGKSSSINALQPKQLHFAPLVAFPMQKSAVMKTCIFIFAALVATALSPSCSSRKPNVREGVHQPNDLLIREQIIAN